MSRQTKYCVKEDTILVKKKNLTYIKSIDDMNQLHDIKKDYMIIVLRSASEKQTRNYKNLPYKRDVANRFTTSGKNDAILNFASMYAQ